MRRGLQLCFSAVLLVMLALTVEASLDRSVFAALGQLWPDPWFRATLADAYFAFLTIGLWIWYKESRVLARAGWLAAIGCLGNLAIAGYLLRELSRLDDGEGVEAILLRRGAP